MPSKPNNFVVNIADLKHVLKQIKIAEATSLGYTPAVAPVSILQAIMDAYGVSAVNAAQLPAGLRTVDGTFNNLLIAPTGTPGTPGYDPGTSEYGAADTLFPRLTDPVFNNDGDGDTMFLGPGAPLITNTNYGIPGRSVADADPRIISNLIIDMSVNNPAAIEVALARVGLTGADAIAARDAIIAARNGQAAATAAAVAAQGAETAALATLAAETGQQAAAVTAAAASASALAAATAVVAQDVIDLAAATTASQTADDVVAAARAADSAALAALLVAQTNHAAAVAAAGSNATALAAATSDLAAATEARDAAAATLVAALATAAALREAEESAAAELTSAQAARTAAQAEVDAAEAALEGASDGVAAAEGALAVATANRESADAALALAQADEALALGALDTARAAHDALIAAYPSVAAGLEAAAADLAEATGAHDAAVTAAGSAATTASAMQALEDAAADDLLIAEGKHGDAEAAHDAALAANQPTAAALTAANADFVAAAAAHQDAIEAVTAAAATATAMEALEETAAGDLLAALEHRDGAQDAYDSALLANAATETALADAAGDHAAATTAHDAAMDAVNEALGAVADLRLIEDAAEADLATAQGNLTTAQLAFADAQLANQPSAAALAAAEADLDSATTAREAAVAALAIATSDAQAAATLENDASDAFALAQAGQMTAQAALDAAAATISAYDDAIAAAADAGANAALTATAGLVARLGAEERPLDAADHQAVTDALGAATTALSAATEAYDALQTPGVAAADVDAAAAVAASAEQLVADLTALQSALADDTLDALDFALIDAANATAIALADLAEVATTALTGAGRTGAQDNLDSAEEDFADADLAFTAADEALAAATADRIAADDALALAEGDELAARETLEAAELAVEAATVANQPTAAALATATTALATATGAVTTAEGLLAAATANTAIAAAGLLAAEQSEATAQGVLDAAQGALETATLAHQATTTALATADGNLGAADGLVAAANGAFASAAADSDSADAALALAREDEVAAGTARDEASTALDAAVLANRPSADALAAAALALADAADAVTAATLALAGATSGSDDADAALALAEGTVAAALTVLEEAQAAHAAAVTANQTAADALTATASDLAAATTASEDATTARVNAAAAAVAMQALEEAAADQLALAQGVRTDALAALDASRSALDGANANVATAEATLSLARAASDEGDTALVLAEEADALAEAALDDARASYDALVAASGPVSSALAAATTALADASSAQDATEAALATASDDAARLQAIEDAAAAELAASQAAQAAAQTADTTAREALATANAELAAAQTAATAATTASNAADYATGALARTLADYGLEPDPSGSLLIPTESPDVGLSPSFNSWMTYFGQFFDHGLDLVTKGGSGTVYIPLQADDPLIPGADGILGNADDLPTHLRFMALTRATQTLDANGVPQHENTTTSFVDQNQTYTSHASHQVFLREYVKDANGHAVSTGKLLDGTAATGSAAGAIANWTDVKAQALTMLGIRLSDFDVHNVPLLVTDQYGKFIPGPNGYAQLVMAAKNPDGSQVVVEGTAAGISTAGALGTGHAFLNDIAHHAAPAVVDHDRNPGTPARAQTADVDTDRNGDGMIDAAELIADDGNNLTYDDELLNSHFITGDGRGNENIALTAVHSIFHTEHNRTVEANKATILEAAAAGDLDFLNEWLLVDVTAYPADPATLVWDGERLFQAARFSTEMQYQHMVFEEFARRIQPMVDPFVFNNSPEIDASIVAEFAHTVYRFGHSMLTGTVDRLTNDLTTIDGADQATLLAVFLNPQAYVGSGATAEEINANLVRGLSRDVGSHIDEFIVDDVRSNLVGLPLDLGALNIARGRDTGVPTLNETRRQLYDDTGLADLKPYESWADFAAHIKNAASIVNFIAAYGTHASITSATTLAGKRAAAELIVFGGEGAPSDRLDFIHATGVFAGGTLGGLNLVDLWIGGLAEANPEFGGMLGTTFNYVFEAQMENLQNGDRMYYLTRTQGLNMLNQLEANTFADMVMRTTALGDDYATHLSGQLFLTPDHILELDRGIAQQDYNGSAPGFDPTFGDDEPHSPFDQKVTRTYTGVTVDGGHDVGGTLRFKGGEHVVLGGTEGDDKLYSDLGDDTLWGDGGDDYLNGGAGADDVFGGDGDDIVEDPFGDDMLRGQAGDDVITSARGFDLMFGNEGQDVILVGQDAGEAFGGQDDDFILGGAGQDFLLGNEGDDWMEGGNGFDTLAGDNSELFFNSSIQGHDVLFGQGDETDYDAESGDDIMGAGVSVYRYEGMFGFDWGIGKGQNSGVSHDLNVKIFVTDADEVLRDRFDHVEALSGHRFNDVLDGDDRGRLAVGDEAGVVQDDLFLNDILTQEGIDRIAGFNQWFEGARQALFGGPDPLVGGTEVATSFRDGNILIGGDGNDTLRGRGGFDLIDGDAYLNVRIGININGTYYSAESLSTDAANGPYAGRVYAMVGNDPAGAVNFAAGPAFGGRSLTSLLLDGTIDPGAMSIVREIKYDDTNVTGAAMNIDTAVFQGTLAEYDIEGRTVDASGNQLTRARDVNGDGFISVHDRDDGVTGAIVNGVELESRRTAVDDTDLVKNIEELRFADQTLVIGGPNLTTAPVLDLHAYDLVTNMTRQYIDNFNVASFSNSNGTTAWTAPWVEANDSGGVTTGQIQLNGGGTEALRFIAGDGASITRAVALDATQPTTLSYTYSFSGLDTGDNLRVEFAADGVNFVTVQTIAGAVATNANLGPTVANIAISGGPNAALRFTVSTLTDIEGIRIEDLSIVSGVTTQVPANDGINYATTYIEDNPAVALALNPTIVDNDSPTLVSAQIRLTNAQAADVLSIAGTLPAGIVSSFGPPVAGQITLNLTGSASPAAYMAALQAVRFSNTSLNPSVTPRTIEITVSDSEGPSPTAVATVEVVSVNDAPVAIADAIVTNITSGNIVIPEWVLLANDSDVDNAVLDISAVSGAAGITGLSLAANPGSVTFAEDGSPGGTFTYTVSDGNALDGTANGTVTMTNTGFTTLADNFNGPNNATPSPANNSTGTTAWTSSWVEADDNANIRTGQVAIDGGAAPGSNALRFGQGDGASITRAVNLAGVTNAALSLSFDKTGIDVGESVLVQFAADGVNFTTLSTITNVAGSGANANGTLSNLVLPGTLGANSAIRFVTSAINEAAESILIDNVVISYGAANANVTAGAGNQVLVGNDAASSFTGGAGNDTVLAGGGNDIINWTVGDGRDFVDGGANDAAGDRFIVNGNGTVETFVVYARAEAIAAGVVVTNAATEIVITRNGVANVVAELDNIEEITINTGAGADTVTAVGNFGPTSLFFNTITVNGNGRDTIDASLLTSAHRLVLNPDAGVAMLADGEGLGRGALVGLRARMETFDFGGLDLGSLGFGSAGAGSLDFAATGASQAGLFVPAHPAAKYNPVSERIALDKSFDADFVPLPQYEHRAAYFDAVDYLII